MKKNFIIILVLLALAIFISGCIGILTTPGDDSIRGGILEIYLTDAPGDYSEVNITISKIEAHIAGEDEESWDVLKEWMIGEEPTFDLIELEDVSILLASLELEPNKYTQLRLFLKGNEEDAWIVLEGPEGPTSKEPLEIPSVYQTGIKLIHPFEIIAGMITKLTIDFDAKKSVVKTGNGEYKLEPVINVTSEIYLEEDIDKGSVSGTVSYDGGDLGLIGIGGASVSLSGGEYIFANTTTTSGEEDFEGTFNLNNVPVGSYTLNVYADGFNDHSESIVVKVDEDTAVIVVLPFKETGAISGSVVDSESIGIEGASVSFTLYGGEYIFTTSTVTNEEGLFAIEQLPVGTYTLTVSAEGYTDHTKDGIVVTKDTITNVDIELIPVI